MKKHRFACLMVLGAYPMVVGLLALLPAAVMHLPNWIKAAVMVPIMVLWMFYVVSPLVQRWGARWLGLGERR